MPLFAHESSFSNGQIVEKFAMHIMKNKINSYNKRELGKFLLEKTNYQKFKKIYNDEFELEDASIETLRQFNSSLNTLSPVNLKEEYDLFLDVNFKEYNFKAESFQIKGGLSKDSYMMYGGRNILVPARNNGSKLFFDNTVDNSNIIYLNKSKARAFMKSIKEQDRNIDRSLIAHYVFVINSFKEEQILLSTNEMFMTIKFMASLKYVDYINKKNNKVIFKYIYKKAEKAKERKILKASSWIKIPSKICKENGGKVYYGECKAHWDIGKQICTTLDARMPLSNDLLELINACGGKVDEKQKTFSPGMLIVDMSSVSSDNEKNKDYIQCINEHNLNMSSDYWGESKKMNANAIRLGYSKMASHINFTGAKLLYARYRGDSFEPMGKSVICVK